MATPLLQIAAQPSMPKCHGLMGMIFGHNFDSCYDDHATQDPALATQLTEALKVAIDQGLDNVSIASVAQAYSDIKAKVSIHTHDLCSRCGQTINDRRSSSSEVVCTFVK